MTSGAPASRRILPFAGLLLLLASQPASSTVSDPSNCLRRVTSYQAKAMRLISRVGVLACEGRDLKKESRLTAANVNLVAKDVNRNIRKIGGVTSCDPDLGVF